MRDIHFKHFKGPYSVALLERESMREGALSNVFHFAVTSTEVITHRNVAAPTVLAKSRIAGIRVAVFDGMTQEEAARRIQAFNNTSLN